MATKKIDPDAQTYGQMRGEITSKREEEKNRMEHARSFKGKSNNSEPKTKKTLIKGVLFRAFLISLTTNIVLGSVVYFNGGVIVENVKAQIHEVTAPNLRSAVVEASTVSAAHAEEAEATPSASADLKVSGREPKVSRVTLPALEAEDPKVAYIMQSRFGDVIYKQWQLESSKGTAPVGLHKTCAAKNQSNEFGYAARQGFCFQNFNQSIDRMVRWWDECNGSLDVCLCTYEPDVDPKTGQKTEDAKRGICTYSKKFHALPDVNFSSAI